jgi:amidohydrolase
MTNDGDIRPRGSQDSGEPAPPAPGYSAPPEILELVDSVSAEHEAELLALRRRLHAEPELSFAETATTEEVAERLLVEGLTVDRLPSGTGLSCDIGDQGDLVALRAELDALAMSDSKDVPYRSRRRGAAHACGHDVHMAIVVGAGIVLNRLHRQDLLPGRVRLIFEPGEEQVPGGAVEVVELGLLRDVSAIFAVHCDPKLQIGVAGTRIGAITSASDKVEIVLSGPGGHTARPHLTVDLVALAAQLIERLPLELEQRMGGPENCRMVFGAVHAGAAANVIPARAELAGSLRTPDVAAWKEAPAALTEALEVILGDSGATWEVTHVRGVPPVVNDEWAARTAARCVRNLLGEEALVETEHSWGGDSFGWMTGEAPGAFLRLGTHNPERGDMLDLHHSRFDVDERVILIGVRLLVRAVLGALADLPR